MRQDSLTEKLDTSEPLSLQSYLNNQGYLHKKKDILLFPSDKNISSITLNDQKYKLISQDSKVYGDSSCDYKEMTYFGEQAGHYITCTSSDQIKRIWYGSELFDDFGSYINL